MARTHPVLAAIGWLLAPVASMMLAGCAQAPAPPATPAANTAPAARAHGEAVSRAPRPAGCMSMADVSAADPPPVLMHAARDCIERDDPARAWALMTTGLGFAYYDLQRLADRSTQGARSVLMMNVFGTMTAAQQDRFQQTAVAIRTDPVRVAAYCAALTRIGPPVYEPLWAIRHGVGVYDEPRDGHYRRGVDTARLWADVLRMRCTVQKE